MTVSNTLRIAGPFNGNGVTTEFPFTFKVFVAADLRIVKTSTLGVETDLVIGSNPTVSLNPNQDSNPGGTITYTTLATGEKLTIVGNIAETQPLDLTNGSGFYASVIETAFDRVTIIAQEIRALFGRAITFPVSDSASLVKELPAANTRKGKALVFSAVDGSVGLSASDYEDQAGDAAASAAAAAASAVASAGSATASATSATNSANSATASANSATASATSATNSANSATASANSATASAASATAAANSFDNFDDRYLGAKASDPTLDNDGNALLDGALYWNTALPAMKVYNLAGTTWQLVTNTTIRSGTGAPSAGLGSNGDFYVDTSVYNIYGPKTAGAWGSPTSLVGPPGPGTGDVVGPGGALDSEVVIYNGSTGKLVKRSSLTATVVKIAAGVMSAASAVTDYVVPGAITTRPLTMATNRLLGRTTAATGAIEEITVGSGMSFTGGVLDVVPPGSVLLATINPTASVNIDALNAFNATYDNYLIIGNGITNQAASLTQLNFRFANAGTADAGSNYRFTTSTFDGTTVGAAQTQIRTGGSFDSTAAGGMNFRIEVMNANATTRNKAAVMSEVHQINSTPTFGAGFVQGAYTAANAISGIRFFLTSGDLFGATGTIRIYGIKN